MEQGTGKKNLRKESCLGYCLDHPCFREHGKMMNKRPKNL
jgi:hypothetical protein